ncbi:hypothetical protein OTU49_013599, partial [Cherax quadricarinatus]
GWLTVSTKAYAQLNLHICSYARHRQHARVCTIRERSKDQYTKKRNFLSGSLPLSISRQVLKRSLCDACQREREKMLLITKRIPHLSPDIFVSIDPYKIGDESKPLLNMSSML